VTEPERFERCTLLRDASNRPCLGARGGGLRLEGRLRRHVNRRTTVVDDDRDGRPRQERTTDIGQDVGDPVDVGRDCALARAVGGRADLELARVGSRGRSAWSAAPSARPGPERRGGRRRARSPRRSTGRRAAHGRLEEQTSCRCSRAPGTVPAAIRPLIGNAPAPRRRCRSPRGRSPTTGRALSPSPRRDRERGLRRYVPVAQDLDQLRGEPAQVRVAPVDVLRPLALGQVALGPRALEVDVSVESLLRPTR
jgi:hypothetical protein